MLADLLERVLIVGGSGQLGSALATVFADREPLTPAHGEFDIECPETIEAALAAFRPTLLINTAAFHNVPLCEERTDRAFAVNALATDRLAALCARAGTFFVHVSTDYVFDGTKRTPYAESDATYPLNAYGASKLAGEHLLARHGDRWLIVRTSGLYAFAGPSSLKGLPFVEKILGQAESSAPLRVVDDVVFSPSYAPHVAVTIRELLESGASGIVHASNSGETSWHGFASAALELAGIRADIERTASSDVPVRRPRYSSLCLDRAVALGAAAPPSWRAGLEEYFSKRLIPTL